MFKLRGVGTKCGAVGSAGAGECVGDDLWSYYDYDSVVLSGLGGLGIARRRKARAA